MGMLLLEIQMDQSQCGEKVQDSRILLLQYWSSQVNNTSQDSDINKFIIW